jgi:dihydromethanopterin reductase
MFLSATPERAPMSIPTDVGGGPPVWKAYAHLIRHWDVTRLPYDGEADRYFDPNWLFAG